MEEAAEEMERDLPMNAVKTRRMGCLRKQVKKVFQGE